jgi:hypothetical protein
MEKSRRSLGALWFLGTSQYCICLFGGGALWLLAAQATGFFWGSLAAQIGASLLLLLVIGLESWWAHVPSSENQVNDYVGDFLTSAAITGFGMAVVLAIYLWVPR